jgi:hypothetical protein
VLLGRIFNVFREKIMKIILAMLLLVCSMSVMAEHHGGRYDGRHDSHYRGHHDHYRGEWRYHQGHGWGWSVPVIVGGVIIGYELSQAQQPIVVQQPPVVVQQPAPVVVQQPTASPVMKYCGPWTETQHPDGSITRSRTCEE